ncbi:hypothetical protein PC118_g20319 [Phytophthora cactorum]|uniref:DDE Tnp4 domain-containing protein n=2 Tax=Phytophthora cactorum TaxID=29920 RepID=A0A8T1F338_9STRA|nr:hypothetical protein PC118_g20319 [Phytophthora cactorum]
MDAEAKAVTVVMLSACAAVLTAATMDKRSCRKPLHTTFEDALHAPRTNWFNKKLRCDRESFLRMYRKVHAAYKPKPAPNSMCPLVKRFALTMLYLAQGGTMDEAATVLGISRPRAVVYINDCLDVPSAMSAKYVLLPGAVDRTLIAIPRPHDFEGWYCRKGFPAVNVQAVVDHRGAFRSISIRAGSNNDQSLWNGSGIRKRLHEFVPPGKYVLGDAGYKIWVHLLMPFPESEVVADRPVRAPDPLRPPGATIIPDIRFNLASPADANAEKEFRFDVRGVLELARLFELPEFVITSERDKAHKTEAVCILLARLSYPNRNYDMMQRFGRSPSALSRLFSHIVFYAYDRYQEIIYFQKRVCAERIQMYCDVVHACGAPMKNVFGFIDGTKIPVCRPSARPGKKENLQK